MPPGFVIATTALPVVAEEDAASWASPMTSPRAYSPAALVARVMSAVIEPITWLRRGADRVL